MMRPECQNGNECSDPGSPHCICARMGSPPMVVKPLVPNPVHVSASALIANIARAEWDGMPPHPEISRAHFLVYREGESEPDIADWHDGKWWMPGVNEGYTAGAVAKAYRYIGPAARPEAEALAEAYCDFVLKQDAMNSAANRDDKPLLAWQAARERLQQAELSYRAAVRRG